MSEELKKIYNCKEYENCENCIDRKECEENLVCDVIQIFREAFNDIDKYSKNIDDLSSKILKCFNDNLTDTEIALKFNIKDDEKVRFDLVKKYRNACMFIKELLVVGD